MTFDAKCHSYSQSILTHTFLHLHALSFFSLTVWSSSRLCSFESQQAFDFVDETRLRATSTATVGGSSLQQCTGSEFCRRKAVVQQSIPVLYDGTNADVQSSHHDTTNDYERTPFIRASINDNGRDDDSEEESTATCALAVEAINEEA